MVSVVLMVVLVALIGMFVFSEICVCCLIFCVFNVCYFSLILCYLFIYSYVFFVLFLCFLYVLILYFLVALSSQHQEPPGIPPMSIIKTTTIIEGFRVIAICNDFAHKI